ncbi:MAG: haloacid dehalogenase type II [Candidatus Latescibacterota bacterium]|nr:MAG: haloacid dehalogenase type II [Candidatus Latescibacterota bacterium]
MVDFNKYRVLTFDCYGTLIDWESGILAAIRPVLAQHGLDPSDRDILETYAPIEAKHEEGEHLSYRLILRMVMAEMSLRFAFDASPKELDCLSAALPNWKPFPDTVAALKKLKSRYKLAVISNIDDDLFEATARRLEVPLDWVITAQQAGAYKPSGKVFAFALDKIGLPREQILHVAQSVYHDIIPARDAGLDTVWVNRRAGLKGSGATLAASATPDVVVTDLESLVDQIFAQ